MRFCYVIVFNSFVFLLLWSRCHSAQAALIVDNFTTGALAQQSASGIDVRQDSLPGVLGGSRRIVVGPADPNGPPDAQIVAVSTEPPGTFTLATQMGAQGFALFYGRGQRLNVDLTSPELSVIEIDLLTVTSPPVFPFGVTLTNEDPIRQASASVALRASDTPYTVRLPLSSLSLLPNSEDLDLAAIDWIGFGITPTPGFSMQIDEIRFVPEPSILVILLIALVFLATRASSLSGRRPHLLKGLKNATPSHHRTTRVSHVTNCYG